MTRLLTAALSYVAVCALAGVPAAIAANYPPASAGSRPIVEAGPAGHAVALAGFGTVGAAFAPPGGTLGMPLGVAPSGPHALALDASGSATAIDTDGTAVQARVAPPGAAFGPPQKLGPFSGGQALLAVDAGGAAAAAWSSEGRLRLAVGAPAAPFAPAVDAGPASAVSGVTIDPGGTVRALVTRPREPASATGPRSDAALVTLRRGAAGPDTVVLAGAEGLALARSVSGQLLAVMRGEPGLKLVTQLIDAAGRAHPSVRSPGGSEPGLVEVLGAVLEPDGRAAVAWIALDGRFLPSHLLVAEAGAGGGFARPRRLDGEGELHSAQLAANASGDAVLVWSALGYRPRAALRPAGGTFATPLIVSARAGDPPTAGVLPDGQALVGWTEREGLVARQVVARVGAAGAAPPQLLAEASVQVQPRERANCRAARRSVLARNRFTVYRRVRGGRREICSLITGYTESLQDGNFGDFLDSVRLAGPLAARAGVSGERDGTDQYAEAAIYVYDTRTGRSPGPLGVDLGEDVAVGDLVLAPDGAYAVSVCATGVDLYGETSPTRLARRLCARAGARVEVIVVDGLGSKDRRVVGRGRTIDPRSLRLAGRRVTWRQNGRSRSATLRRIQLPG